MHVGAPQEFVFLPHRGGLHGILIGAVSSPNYSWFPSACPPVKSNMSNACAQNKTGSLVFCFFLFFQFVTCVCVCVLLLGSNRVSSVSSMCPNVCHPPTGHRQLVECALSPNPTNHHLCVLQIFHPSILQEVLSCVARCFQFILVEKY